MRFLNATCFYPVKSIWTKEIENGNFTTFPGLNVTLVQQHLLSKIPKTQGHQHQLRQGTRSTMARDAMATVVLEPEVHEMHYKMIESPYLMCTDKTGKFLAQSKSGDNYRMIFHDYYESDMLEEPIPNSKTETLQELYLKTMSQVKQKGKNLPT